MQTTDEQIPVKAAKLLRFAKSAQKRCKNWHELHNQIFGVGGKLSELFPTRAGRLAFSRTDEAESIHAMIDALPGGDAEFARLRSEANGKILIRVPKSIHAKLLMEAEAEGVSLNLLCVSKLSSDLAAVLH